MTTSAPPSYPRVAHLVAGRGGRDDTALRPDEVAALLDGPVVVEEKLDGANVVLWLDRDVIQSATRGGPGARDRAGHLGPLRAWVAERSDELRSLLAGGDALYAEWLLLTHGLAYDRLPAHLVALDVRRPDGTFAAVDERNARCSSAGLAVPPELFRGVLADVASVEALLGPSRVGAVEAEGVVVRTLDGRPPRLAKLVRAGFTQASDEAWARGRPRNRVAV